MKKKNIQRLWMFSFATRLNCILNVFFLAIFCYLENTVVNTRFRKPQEENFIDANNTELTKARK